MTTAKTILRRSWIAIIGALIIVVLFTPIHKQSQNQKIVTSIFPIYSIANDLLENTDYDLELLIKPGNEVHDYEPTPQDIIDIQNAQIIIYNGGESEVWLEKIIANTKNDITIIRLMDYIDIIPHDTDEYDEHIWLSPQNIITIIDKLSSTLGENLNNQNNQISQNATKAKRKYQELHQELIKLSNETQKYPIIVADHFPFAYFVRDYNLAYESAYAGCSHESEPSSSKITELIETIKSQKIPIIYTTEFSNQKIAKTISSVTNSSIKTLYSAETISPENYSKNVDLYDLLQQNYYAIKELYDDVAH